MPIYERKYFSVPRIYQKELIAAATDFFAHASGPTTEKFAFVFPDGERAYFYGVSRAKTWSDALYKALQRHHGRGHKAPVAFELLYRCGKKSCSWCKTYYHRDFILEQDALAT